MKTDSVVKVMDKGLEWSIYIAIFALPFSKSIIEICVSLGLVLLSVKKILLRDFKLMHTSANPAILALIVSTVSSLINSQYMDLSLRALFSKTLKFIILYYLVVEIINSKVKLMNFLKIAAVSAAVVFLDTLAQYFITHVDLLHNYVSFKYVNNFILVESAPAKSHVIYFIGYPTGPFPFPNDLAAWLLIIIPPALFLSLIDLRGKISRYAVAIFSFAGLYILILAKARSAWIGFIIAISSLIVLFKKYVIVLLCGMFIVMAVCFIRTPEDIFGLSSAQDRAVMWSTGFKIFKEHPFIGNGVNTFFNKYKEARQDEWRGLKGSYAHNCYLQMAADIGIFGLASFLWFIVSIMISSVQFIKGHKDRFYPALILGLLVGVTAFLIHSFFDTNLYSLNLAGLFWMAAGLTVSVVNIAKSHIS